MGAGVIHPGIPGAVAAPGGWQARMRQVAMSWVGTPFRPRGQVKGRQGGVDCCTFIIGLFSELGCIPFFTPEYYSMSVPLVELGERYMNSLMTFTYKVDDESPMVVGDVMMFKFPGAASSGHAAVWLGGLEIVHADWKNGVMIDTLRRVLFHNPSGRYRLKGT